MLAFCKCSNANPEFRGNVTQCVDHLLVLLANRFAYQRIEVERVMLPEEFFVLRKNLKTQTLTIIFFYSFKLKEYKPWPGQRICQMMHQRKRHFQGVASSLSA